MVSKPRRQPKAAQPEPPPELQPEPPPAVDPTPEQTARQIKAALAAVEHTEDVVEFTLRCLFALAPQFGEEVRQAADRHVREMFGGRKVWVSTRAGEGRAERNEQIRADFQRGERVGLLARRYGVTKRRILQIIKS